jgi:integrase
MIEVSTREGYSYLLERYLLPELGRMRIGEIMPSDVRAWVTRMQSEYGARPPTIRKCKVVLDAILTTAMNDQITMLHAGRGVRTPPVVAKPRRIITAEQFDRLLAAIPDPTMRLLVETDIETGLRWGELTELRVKDLDVDARILTVCRVAVHLRAAAPDGARFLVKGYPKDRESRRVRLAPEIVEKLVAHIKERDLGPEDLLFTQPAPGERARATLPTGLPDPETLGLTAPNEAGLRYRHGTMTAYTNGRCRCRHCRAAMNAYRTERRRNGLDRPRRATSGGRDDHVSNSWFRTQIWRPALAAAQLGFHITPHGLRHAHASWLLAGGADVQVVKERLGHARTTLPDAAYKEVRALGEEYRARNPRSLA